MVSVTPNTSPREISDNDSLLPSIWKKVRIDITSSTGRKNDLSISSTGTLGKRPRISCLVGSTQRHSTQSSARYCRKPAVMPARVNTLALMRSAAGTIRWVRLAIRGLLSLRLTRDSLLMAATNSPTWMSTEPRCR